MKNKFKMYKLVLFITVIICITLFYNEKIIINVIDSINYKYNDILNIKKIDNNDLVFYELNKLGNYNEEIDINTLYDIEVPKNINNYTKDPIIYIYNTHQTEEYDYKKLEHTVKPNVFYASLILKDHLNNLNINAVVESSSIKKYLIKNNLSYNGSYDASRYYLKNALKKYSTIEYIIDLHRDSASKKVTTIKRNNKSYAKVMFVVSMKHKNHKKNLSFVTNINNRLNKEVKGISRGLYKRNDVIFNQDLNKNAILLELGGVDNTLEEINNTLEVISKIYNDYIKDNKNGTN